MGASNGGNRAVPTAPPRTALHETWCGAPTQAVALKCASGQRAKAHELPCIVGEDSCCTAEPHIPRFRSVETPHARLALVLGLIYGPNGAALVPCRVFCSLAGRVGPTSRLPWLTRPPDRPRVMWSAIAPRPAFVWRSHVAHMVLCRLDTQFLRTVWTRSLERPWVAARRVPSSHRPRAQPIVRMPCHERPADERGPRQCSSPVARSVQCARWPVVKRPWTAWAVGT